MLKFHYRRVVADEVSEPTESIADTNPDLRIRDLLDHPALHRAMSLELEFSPATPPVRPLNRRRLLEQAAA